MAEGMARLLMLLTAFILSGSLVVEGQCPARSSILFMPNGPPIKCGPGQPPNCGPNTFCNYSEMHKDYLCCKSHCPPGTSGLILPSGQYKMCRSNDDCAPPAASCIGALPMAPAPGPDPRICCEALNSVEGPGRGPSGQLMKPPPPPTPASGFPVEPTGSFPIVDSIADLEWRPPRAQPTVENQLLDQAVRWIHNAMQVTCVTRATAPLLRQYCCTFRKTRFAAQALQNTAFCLAQRAAGAGMAYLDNNFDLVVKLTCSEYCHTPVELTMGMFAPPTPGILF